jgi:hypothetical protein
MPITDPQYKVTPLGYEEDTRYVHGLLHLQRIHKDLLVQGGFTEEEAELEAHRAMVDTRLDALERARKLNSSW